jgi:hypothetical protein
MGTRIEIKSTAVQSSTATLMKTGQTTSYVTGDDGDIQAGRLVDFNILSTNNPFGNTDRFTDTLGGQTYTNNIVIDWSTFDGTTVLGYYKVIAGNQTWNNAINSALLVSAGTFTSGWRMSNVRELLNIYYYVGGLAHALDYFPFNTTITTVHSFWTSTTDISNSINAYYSPTVTGVFGVVDKTAVGAKYLAVRTFGWNGTQLT